MAASEISTHGVMEAGASYNRPGLVHQASDLISRCDVLRSSSYDSLGTLSLLPAGIERRRLKKHKNCVTNSKTRKERTKCR
jgi:hypothetical protein